MERISGPFLGHYVAAYAVATDQGYVGYAKFCTHTPVDVWQCKAIDKISARPQGSYRLALEAVERRARLFLQLLHQYGDGDSPLHMLPGVAAT
ncbi:hypothetical protein [Ramlibacter sp. WS9]|uniref:hypothetical protein n=1 Tax=Ramlibacter sp. WS9 TaxID=1882741 RepID=UPI00114154E9|nr:hypothetical protein [Ramlibacter sp. WS9]